MKRKEKKKMGAGSIIFMALVYLFLYMPVFVIILFSFNKNNTNMVFDGFTLKWYLEVFQGDSLLKNFWLSIELALVSMVISVVLGTLATIGLYRYEFKLKKFINGLLYVPIVIPELVIGLASLASFSKMGMTMVANPMVMPIIFQDGHDNGICDHGVRTRYILSAICHHHTEITNCEF